jgi:hypothetical protein
MRFQGFLSRSGFPLIQEYRVGAAESAGLISVLPACMRIDDADLLVICKSI